MYQVVVAGEIVDANVDAEEDLSFKIPPADFTEIPEEAGVPEEAAKALQAKLHGAGYGRALPWVNPVRAELSALGIGSGYLDGIIMEVKKYLLDSVGVAYLQALVGGGSTTAEMAKELRVGKGAPAYSQVLEKHGYLPTYERFIEESEAIIGWVDTISNELAHSLMSILNDWELELATFGASFPKTPPAGARRAGMCGGRPGGYAFGKVPQGGPRSHIGPRRALS